MKDHTTDCLLSLLKLMGQDWEENSYPAKLWRCERAINAMVRVRHLVADPNALLTAEMVRTKAPAFSEFYEQVCLRPL